MSARQRDTIVAVNPMSADIDWARVESTLGVRIVQGAPCSDVPVDEVAGDGLDVAEVSAAGLAEQVERPLEALPHELQGIHHVLERLNQRLKIPGALIGLTVAALNHRGYEAVAQHVKLLGARDEIELDLLQQFSQLAHGLPSQSSVAPASLIDTAASSAADTAEAPEGTAGPRHVPTASGAPSCSTSASEVPVR